MLIKDEINLGYVFMVIFNVFECIFFLVVINLFLFFVWFKNFKGLLFSLFLNLWDVGSVCNFVNLLYWFCEDNFFGCYLILFFCWILVIVFCLDLKVWYLSKDVMLVMVIFINFIFKILFLVFVCKGNVVEIYEWVSFYVCG